MENLLGTSKKPRVGLSWRGNPNHPNDKRRSLALRDIIETLDTEFGWLSLQFDITGEETDLIESSQKISNFGTLIGDFYEAAVVCKNLDANICVDTSIAHSAVSLGSNTYLLLAQVADSRWHAHGNTFPWHDIITIFRKDPDTNYRKLIRQAKILINQKQDVKTTGYRK